MTRPRVLIIGAGFAGFARARELERLRRPDEDNARQTAERILAHDQEGWPT